MFKRHCWYKVARIDDGVMMHGINTDNMKEFRKG